MATKFDQNNPWSELNAMLGQMLCRGHPRSKDINFLKCYIWLQTRKPEYTWPKSQVT